MSDAKHTPGPWGVDPKRSFRVLDVSDNTICSTGSCDHIRDQWEANAHLIAAAPDLLSACEEAFDAMHDDGHERMGMGRAIEACRAAIAKAKGETPPC